MGISKQVFVECICDLGAVGIDDGPENNEAAISDTSHHSRLTTWLQQLRGIRQTAMTHQDESPHREDFCNPLQSRMR